MEAPGAAHEGAGVTAAAAPTLPAVAAAAAYRPSAKRKRKGADKDAVDVVEVEQRRPKLPRPLANRTRGRLKELMAHGLLTAGPEALTIDVMGESGPVRFYAGIDDKCVISLVDHGEPIESLEELVLLCVDPTRVVLKTDLLSNEDAAGWLLVKHHERPLSVLMSALCMRKMQVTPVVSPTVHQSIFEESAPTSTRVRKSVQVFTYSFDELNPGLKKLQEKEAAKVTGVIEGPPATPSTVGAVKSKKKGSTDKAKETKSKTGVKGSSKGVKSDGGSKKSKDGDKNKKRKDPRQATPSSRPPQKPRVDGPASSGLVLIPMSSSFPVPCPRCEATVSSVASWRRHLMSSRHNVLPAEAERLAQKKIVEISSSPEWQKMVARKEKERAEAATARKGTTKSSSAPSERSHKAKSKTFDSKSKKKAKPLVTWEATPEHRDRQKRLFEQALKSFFAESPTAEGSAAASTIGTATAEVTSAAVETTTGAVAASEGATATNDAVARNNANETVVVVPMIESEEEERRQSHTAEPPIAWPTAPNHDISITARSEDAALSALQRCAEEDGGTAAPAEDSAVPRLSVETKRTAPLLPKTKNTENISYPSGTAIEATVMHTKADAEASSTSASDGTAAATNTTSDIGEPGYPTTTPPHTASGPDGEGVPEHSEGSKDAMVASAAPDVGDGSIVIEGGESGEAIKEPDTDAVAAEVETAKPTRELRKYRRTKAVSVAHDGDPFSMIKCMCFSATRMPQPFRVHTSTSALFIMDLHAHLACTEVIGLLGGRWDPTTKVLTIDRAYPCKAIEPSDGPQRDQRKQSVEMEGESQFAAHQKIESADRVVVGWYHSHPVFMAEPSIRDIDQQQMIQKFMKSGADEPYVGYIVAPYEDDAPRGDVADVRCFWIDHVNTKGRGTPMAAEYTEVRDALDEGEWEDMREMIAYYEVYPERQLMTKSWGKNKVPRLEKLIKSLEARLTGSSLSKAQADAVLGYVHDALNASDELHQAAIVSRARKAAERRAIQLAAREARERTSSEKELKGQTDQAVKEADQSTEAPAIVKSAEPTQLDEMSRATGDEAQEQDAIELIGRVAEVPKTAAQLGARDSGQPMSAASDEAVADDLAMAPLAASVEPEARDAGSVSVETIVSRAGSSVTETGAEAITLEGLTASADEQSLERTSADDLETLTDVVHV